MNVKTSQVLTYQIMKSNIIPHNNVTTKSWIIIFAMTVLQLKTFKTEIKTNTRALVSLTVWLCGQTGKPY